MNQGWLVLGLIIALFVLLGAFSLAGRPRGRAAG
jgi:hypothetical protein